MTKLNIFTSDLIIDAARKEVEKDFATRAEELAESFSSDFDWYNNKKLTRKSHSPLKMYDFLNKDAVERICKEYSEKKGLKFIDATSCVKGLFLQNLYQTVCYDFITENLHEDLYNEKFLLSFGGDILGTDTDYSIVIENTPIRLKPTRGPFYCFTSGNYGSRGRHILEVGNDEWKSLTVCGNLDPLTGPNWYGILAYLDCYTTDCYSHQDPTYFIIHNPRYIDSLTHVWVNINGNIEVNPILTGKGGVQWFI